MGTNVYLRKCYSYDSSCGDDLYGELLNRLSTPMNQLLLNVRVDIVTLIQQWFNRVFRKMG